MRVIAKSRLDSFAARNPRTRPSLDHWYRLAKANSWASTQDVASYFSKAKVINNERVRFEIADHFRLIVAFDFHHQIAFVKFVGTHDEYDRIDAATVSLF